MIPHELDVNGAKCGEARNPKQFDTSYKPGESQASDCLHCETPEIRMSFPNGLFRKSGLNSSAEYSNRNSSDAGLPATI